MNARVGLLLLAWQTLAWLDADAGAAPPTLVALEYEVSSDAVGCPSAEAFRASVARQLGHDPFRAISDRRVAVQIVRKEKSFAGVIRWSDARGRWVGERLFSSRRQECDGIAANLAFSVAVQVQLLEALAPPRPETPLLSPTPITSPNATVPPDRNPATAPIAEVIAPPLPPIPAAHRFRLSLGLGPSLALGLSPQPTALGRIFASGRVARVSLEVGVDAALPSQQREIDGSGFSLDRFAASAAACGHARVFAACVTATLGLLRARGFGVDEPASPLGLFSQSGVRLAAMRALGDRYFVQARVDGLVMLSSSQVTLNRTTAWTTPRVGVLVGLDVGSRVF